jgi:hypothetical protein
MTRRTVFAACLGWLATQPAAAAPAATPDALLAPVQALVQAINHGAETPPAAFTADAVVLDDFAPYRWSGNRTGQDWYRDLLGAGPKGRADFLAMQGRLSVGSPQFSRVTGSDAYLVLPATFAFNTDPKTRVLQKAAWVITEHRVDGKWLIAGHAWAITGEGPAPK